MNPDARDYIINAAKYWLSLGLDGFRLDHVIGPPHPFWKIFRREIKERYPNAVLIGEAWMLGIKRRDLRTLGVRGKYWKWLFGAASDSLLREYIGELDGVLDFRFQELLKKHISTLQKKRFNSILRRHYARFPDGYFLPTFLDNHDMDRFLFQCGNNVKKLKEAARIQFDVNQPPIIYYGTEIGMTQTKSIWSIPKHGDLQARQPMNWKKQNKALLRFYKRLIMQRKKACSP
jgi:glycosidase